VLQPELVLLDLAMPVMSGAEAASVLKAMLPRTKIILFSMHMDNVPRSLAAAVGVDLALSKADGITKLGEHLKKLLAPIDAAPETPNLETPQSISSNPSSRPHTDTVKFRGARTQAYLRKLRRRIRSGKIAGSVGR